MFFVFTSIDATSYWFVSCTVAEHCRNEHSVLLCRNQQLSKHSYLTSNTSALIWVPELHWALSCTGRVCPSSVSTRTLIVLTNTVTVHRRSCSMGLNRTRYLTEKRRKRNRNHRMVEEQLRGGNGQMRRNEDNTSVLLGPARLGCAEAESLELHVYHPIDVKYNEHILNIGSKICKTSCIFCLWSKSVSQHSGSPSPGKVLSGKSDKTLCSSSPGNELHWW